MTNVLMIRKNLSGMEMRDLNAFTDRALKRQIPVWGHSYRRHGNQRVRGYSSRNPQEPDNPHRKDIQIQSVTK
jgi:hypothetical protein